jgi:hypothetical protein
VTIPGKDDQLGASLFDHREYAALLCRLVMGIEREVVIGNVVPGGQGLKVGMVGNDRDHVHGQLADALAVQQVIETVIGLGDHDHDLGAKLRRGQLEEHAELSAPLAEAGAKALFIEAFGLPELDADEKARAEAVVEGVVFGDVAALLEQVAGDRVHRAEQAGAVGGEDPGVGGAAHGLASLVRWSDWEGLFAGKPGAYMCGVAGGPSRVGPAPTEAGG